MRYGVLALTVTVVFCVIYGRTHLASWLRPIQYRGDALFLLAYLKAAAEGHVVPGHTITVPALNAPFGANWNDYPRPLKVWFFLGGLLARRAGLFVTANLLLLAAHVLAALSFFGVARYLRCRWEWALVGALAFGMSPYILWRSFEHLDLSLYWHLPLCVLTVGWCFRRAGLGLRSRHFPMAFLVTAVAALHNPYYGILFGQFLLLAAGAQATRPSGRRHMLGPLVLLLALGAVAAADNAGILLFHWREGLSTAAMVRPYGNIERFGLKPIELLLPPPQRGLEAWGSWASAYWEGRLYRGEGGAQYLGLVGLAGLVWLAITTVRPVVRGEKARMPPAAAAIVWILGFSMIGGINGLVGLFGLPWMRATNRHSIWILTLVLLYFVGRLSRVAAARPARLASAVLLAALLLADQVRGIGPNSHEEQANFESDRVFVAGLEAVLPEGAMLFQYPPIDFPEGKAVCHAHEYEHLRPYLFSSRLRFSFGTDKGRSWDEWQASVVARSPAQLVSRLELYGFHGLIVHRGAFADRGVGFLAALAEAGRPFRPGEALGTWAFVPLHPDKQPTLPVTFTQVAGDAAAAAGLGSRREQPALRP